MQAYLLNLNPDTPHWGPGEFIDMLQNNHRDFYNFRACTLGTQWIQTNYEGFSNSGTCILDAQLCPQVNLGSPEPIKGS